MMESLNIGTNGLFRNPSARMSAIDCIELNVRCLDKNNSSWFVALTKITYYVTDLMRSHFWSRATFLIFPRAHLLQHRPSFCVRRKSVFGTVAGEAPLQGLQYSNSTESNRVLDGQCLFVCITELHISG